MAGYIHSLVLRISLLKRLTLGILRHSLQLCVVVSLADPCFMKAGDIERSGKKS
jgi:hypothetical protein